MYCVPNVLIVERTRKLVTKNKKCNNLFLQVIELIPCCLSVYSFMLSLFANVFHSFLLLRSSYFIFAQLPIVWRLIKILICEALFISFRGDFGYGFNFCIFVSFVLQYKQIID